MIIPPRKYANGGPVKAASKGPKRPKQESFSTVDVLRGSVRRKREQALGLRDGGKVKLPGRETRKVPPAPLPAPQPGAKPKRIGKR